MKKLILLFILFFVSINVYALEIREKDFDINNKDYLSNKKVNPLWSDYIAGSNMDGAIISEYVVEPEIKSSSDILNYYKVAGDTSIPSSFDLRDVDGNNYTTPVRDQGTLGLCWAFSISSSIESNLLLKGKTTSSNPVYINERQLDYAIADGSKTETSLKTPNFNIFSDINYNPYQALYETYGGGTTTRKLGSGGRFDSAINVMNYGLVSVANKSGTAWSSYWTGSVGNEQQKTSKEVFDKSNELYSVTDFTEFPYIDNAYASESQKKTFRNYVKRHIMENGSVYVATLGPGEVSSGSCSYMYYDSETSNYTYLINWKTSCGISDLGYHAMSIIGWDDNYTISYCDLGNRTTSLNGSGNCSLGTKTTITGAWILKNSWGTEAYNAAPYLYLAYSSRFDEVAGVNNVIEKDWDNNYDEVSSLVYYNYDLINSTLYEEFKVSGNEEILKRVSVLHESTSSSRFTVFVDGGSGYKQVGYYQHNGYTYGMFSIEPSSQIKITSDTVKVKIVGSKIENITSVSVFTNDVTSSSTKSASVNVYDDVIYTQNNNKYKMMFGVNAENYDTGTEIYYQVRNKYSGSNPSSYLTIDGLSNIFNESANGGIIYNSKSVPYGTYVFEVYNNSTKIAENEFSIEPQASVSSISIAVDQAKKISYTADLSKSVYSSSVSYYSTNEDIATVDSEGNVTGVAIGSANIGVVIHINGAEFSYEAPVEVTFVGFDNYVVDGSYLYMVPGKTSSTFNDSTVHLAGGYSFVYEYSTDYIGTGSTIKIKDGSDTVRTYTVVITGDINGDGKIGIGDVSKLYNHFMGSNVITNAAVLSACDTNNDDKIGIGDVTRLYNFFMGNISSL